MELSEERVAELMVEMAEPVAEPDGLRQVELEEMDKRADMPASLLTVTVVLMKVSGWDRLVEEVAEAEPGVLMTIVMMYLEAVTKEVALVVAVARGTAEEAMLG